MTTVAPASSAPRDQSTMTPSADPPSPAPPWDEKDPLFRARREKLERWRDTYGITGYGHRVDGLMSLADARARFDQAAHDRIVAADEAGETVADDRPAVLVTGRMVQHRAMGKLVFLDLRDHTGDLQVSVSKAAIEQQGFKLAQKLDYGDIVVVGGRMGMTKKGEVCIWADRFEVHAKSLAPPPEKFHGLTDPELRYRQRYVDMYANPETIQTFKLRSQLMAATRQFMEGRDFLEVETPMMQPIAGGAAARPFITHHNALDMSLYLRIAPELYLKRLLVGGLPRVFEVNRNFRNEGIDRRHNPEFTMMEVYQAFGDCETMLELTESLVRSLAELVGGEAGATLPFGDLQIDYARPFERVEYGDLFERALGFAMTDEAKVRDCGREHGIENAATLDHWLLVNEIFEDHAEHTMDPARPTFLTGYPSAISPLTRPRPGRPRSLRPLGTLHRRHGDGERLHRAERSAGAVREVHRAAARRRRGSRDLQDAGRGFPAVAARGHATRRWPGRRHRPAHHAAHGLCDHPRRDSLPADASPGRPGRSRDRDGQRRRRAVGHSISPWRVRWR